MCWKWPVDCCRTEGRAQGNREVPTSTPQSITSQAQHLGSHALFLCDRRLCTLYSHTATKMSDKAIENGEAFVADALLQESQWDGECPGDALEGEVTQGLGCMAQS